MRNLVLIILFLFSWQLHYGQNLVPNGGFELTYSCPGWDDHITYLPTYSGFPHVSDWTVPGSGMKGQYFHTCGHSNFAVPSNACGTQYPHSGNAYAGISVAWDNYHAPPYDSVFTKALLVTRLFSPLQRDSSYFIRFFVSPSLTGPFYGGGFPSAAVNDIGANLSVNRPDFSNMNHELVQLKYDIKNDSSQLLIDESRWYEISGVYKAKGGERWLTMGYLDKGMPRSFSKSTWATRNYTYLDDVSVLPVFTTSHRIINCDSALSGKTKLQSGMANASYQWNTGDTTRSIYVFQPGTYRCAAYNDSVYTIDSFSVLPKTYTSYAEVPACDLLGVPAMLQAGLSPAKYTWSTGDTGRVILPTVPALYTCVSSNACAIRKDSFLVKADSVRNHYYRPVCDTSGFNLVLTVKPSPYYSWNSGATTQQIQATRTGAYVCRSFDGCLFAIDSFNVTLVLPERPQVRDTNICQFIDSPQIQLRDTGLVWYASAWSPRWTLVQPAINTSVRGETTLYVARKIGDCVSERVPLTVRIRTMPRPRAADTLNICDGLILPIGIGYPDVGDLSYRWSTGDDNVAILPKEIREYTRLGRNECGAVTDTFRVVNQPCDRCVFFPTAFSPNGDSRNDRFGPQVRCSFEKYSLSVYNRWGERVFYTNDMSESWDGTYKGVQAPVGTYMFMSSMYHAGTDVKLFRKGDVILIR